MSEQHDEHLRRRLRAAAEREAARGLDASAHARIARTLGARGARGPQKLLAGGAAVGLAAAAAAALAFLPRAAPPSTTAKLCVLSAEAPRLEQRDGAQRVSLGDHGALLAPADSVFTISSADACSLRVALTHGRLAVDVHALAASRLYIDTPHGTVVVKGTQFAVDVGDSLSVDLVEGVVDVDDGAQHTTLAAGNSLVRRRAGGSQRTAALTPQARAGVSELLELGARFDPRAPHAVPELAPPPAPAIAPAPPASTRKGDFLARAEEARQRGDRKSARHFYARATRTVPADAEVALLRWARFELAEARLDVARGLLARHRREFARGTLGAEALWLEVSVHEARNDVQAARRAAEELRARYPDAPQARAAQRMLGP